MHLTMISGHSPFLAVPRQRSLPTESASADHYSSSPAASLQLIPSNLVPPAVARAGLSAFSPAVLEAHHGAELASAAGMPGLSVIPLAKEGDKAEILALFERWNDALKTGDPDQVVAQYAPDAILLPTVSNKVRHTPAEIRDYFEHFLAKGPEGKIDESNVRMFGDVAINSGVYTFNFANGDAVQARFTYVYRKLDGEWKIVEHHSSAMPEKSPQH
jgi:uncharacterized protein (TIGR02246 family)